MRPIDGAVALIFKDSHVQAVHWRQFALAEDDCAAMGQVRELRSITLLHCRLSQRGLSLLLTAPALCEAKLQRCDTDAGEFPDWPGSTRLESITLDMKTTNSFGSFAARCPHLKQLSVKGDLIDDAFIARLGPHAAVENLSLASTSITDVSLSVLGRMPSLRLLTLPADTISQQGVATLSAARPDIRIYRPAPDPE